MRTLGIALVGIALSVFVLVRCGSDSAAPSSNPLAAAGVVLGITSPTATTTSSAVTASRSILDRVSMAMLGLPGIKALISFFKSSETRVLAAEATAPTDVKDYATEVAALSTALTADPTTTAASVEFAMTAIKTYQAECYGPSFSETLSNDGASTVASVDHPSGDTGMMLATQDATKTQACAAAQLNALIGSPSAKMAREALELEALLLAKANKEGKSLPAITDPAVTVTLPTITGVTITSASLDRLADDADGNPVYKTVVTGTEDSTTKAISITLYNTPTSTGSKGLLQIVSPHTVTTGGTKYRGTSMIYTKNGTETAFILESAANRNTETQTFFSTTTGRVNFGGTGFGEDGVRFHAVVTEATKAWAVNYSWQAGSSDTRVRSFAVKTTGTGTGATGTAYFGFGGDITTITDTNFYTAALTGINCNWINGVTLSTHTANKAQKQTLTWSSTEFVPGTSNITMAPSDNCSSTVGAFTYGNPSVGAAKPSWLTSPTSAITNNLVATSGIATDIGTLTVPTFTLPSGS